MNGHEKLVEMRLKGHAPEWVFINDFPCQTNWFETNEQPTICVAGDNLKQLGFFYLTGLRVVAVSSDLARATYLHSKLIASGAATVASSHIPKDDPHAQLPGWTEIWEKSC
jgi:hypothetical protein